MEGDVVRVQESRCRKGGPLDPSTEEEEPAHKLPCLEDHRIREMGWIKVTGSGDFVILEKADRRGSPKMTKEETGRSRLEPRSRNTKLALKLYNERHRAAGQELELVHPVKCRRFVQRCLWYHMNFIAKPKNASDDKKLLYFAEIQHWGLNRDYLTAFYPVETAVSGGQMVNGCSSCSEMHEIYHPPPGTFEISRPFEERTHYGKI